MLSSNVVCNSVITQCCSLQAQHNNQILSGGRVSAYLTLGEMFSQNNQLYVAMLQESYKYCVGSGLVPTDALQVRQSWLSFYGVALSGLFYLYLRDEDSFVLCTSSIGVLNNLANKGLICDKEMKPERTLACARDNLCFTSKKTLQGGYASNTVATVMLVPVSSDGVRFKYGVRRISCNADNCIIVPHSCAVVCNDFIHHKAKDQLLEITMGTKRRVVTESPQVLSKFYTERRVSELLSLTKVGNPLCKDTLYMPVVGASVDSLGTTSIKISKIDTIRVVDSSYVNTSTISLDLFAIKMYVSDVVARASFEDVYTLSQRMGINANPNDILGVLRKDVISRISEMSNTEVYESVMGYSKLFSTDAYKKFAERYGTTRTEITITSLEQLKQCLSKYICQLTLQSGKGGMYRCLATNNSQILRKMYGKQYIRKYGNSEERITLLKEELNKLINTSGNDTLLGSEVARILRAFGFRTEGVASTDEFGDVYTVMDILDMARRQADSNDTQKRSKNPDMVSVQRLNMLYGEDDVFRTFNRLQLKKCVIFK